ncbi:hypothetical protein A4R35_11030 [Thermogemmatispora tikiterensis]|uniref:Uncharacterized protein n=1 Tax=Thermogemmatispora tikiterensis TaxID=1825093 RepID=A0A328VEU3_9CHLR|nr:hypothetical protein A4R35_11030 [Thermogemmatispora tikiterensis]
MIICRISRSVSRSHLCVPDHHRGQPLAFLPMRVTRGEKVHGHDLRSALYAQSGSGSENGNGSGQGHVAPPSTGKQSAGVLSSAAVTLRWVSVHVLPWKAFRRAAPVRPVLSPNPSVLALAPASALAGKEALDRDRARPPTTIIIDRQRSPQKQRSLSHSRSSPSAKKRLRRPRSCLLRSR